MALPPADLTPSDEINGDGSTPGYVPNVGFSTSRSYVTIYRTQQSFNNSVSACNSTANILAYAQNPSTGTALTSYSQIGSGTRIYTTFQNGAQPMAPGNGYFGIRDSSTGTGSPVNWVRLLTIYGNNHFIMIKGLCSGATPPPTPTPDLTPLPTVTLTPVNPPSQGANYPTHHWFTVLNDSYSKKIFGYYSGSANFSYKVDLSTTASSDTVTGPSSGHIQFNSSSYFGAQEKQSTEIYIDVKDTGSQEDIITYITQLDTITDKGSIRIQAANSASYHLQFDVDSITTQSITTNGWIELTVSNGQSSPSNNPFSSSLEDASLTTASFKDAIIKFENDALLGYHEIEIPGSSSVSFIAAIEQTSSAIPSGSIPGPFNTSWGVPESEFLSSSYSPSTKGSGYMWNDGYKAKHIKLNNTSVDNYSISNFIKDSEASQFVLFNPIRANRSKLYPNRGNYSENYQLSNAKRFVDHSHLRVDQLNLLTSFAVDSENYASTNFNFDADGKYIVYATQSGTVTHPTASAGITSSIPQGYFPATLAQEQFFRGWENANYYVNGNLRSKTGGNSFTDELLAFNTGSTERDYDTATDYIPSSLPWFIDASASFTTVVSESIKEYNFQNNLIQIGPIFRTSDGGETKYYYQETTGDIIISGSEHIDIKKTPTPEYDSLYNVELVPATTNTVFFDTGDGLTIEVEPSQSLWLSRGIATPGTLNADNWKYNRYFHRPYKVYALTSTGSYIKGYSEELYGEIVYREGPYPVGPPPNELEKIYVVYSESAATGRPNDGIYTFPKNLSEDVTIHASAELDYLRNAPIARARYGEGLYSQSEYGQLDTGSIKTWETASLHLYKNNSILTSSIFHNVSASIVNGITLQLTQSVSKGGMLTGDKLKLSVEVDGLQSDFNAALRATNYSLDISAPVPETSDLIPVNFDNALQLIDDCEPTINNIVGSRPNERLQDVDYSVDVLKPINFDQILKDEAVRASVPESNFTQLGFSNTRYFGSSTSRREVNEYNGLDHVDSSNQMYYIGDGNVTNKGKGASLGKIPNVELKNGYIAYFNEVIDPYPTLNNKTAYYVKYLIDESGTVFDPTLSDINFSIFEGTFKLQDYDLKPTRAKVSLQNVDESKELSKLNKGISSTFKIGEYPVPILYSQTSSLGHTNNIILSGSPFYGTLGIGGDWTNFSMNVLSRQTHFEANTGGDHRKTSVDFALKDVYFLSDDVIAPTGSEILPTSSFSGGFKIDFPKDDEMAPVTQSGDPLSDNFTINGAFEFYTTTAPGRYRANRNDWNDYDNMDLYTRGQSRTSYRQPFNFELFPYKNGVNTTNGFTFKGIELQIIVNPGQSIEEVLSPITIERTPSGFQPQYSLAGGKIRLTPDSVYLEKAILQGLLGKDWTNQDVRRQNAHLVGGGYTPKQGATDNGIEGVLGKAVIYKWKINFAFLNVKQFDDFYFKAQGEWTQAGDDGGQRPCSNKRNDFFHMHNGGSNFNSQNCRYDIAWKSTFSPDVATLNTDVTSYDTDPILTYQVTSPLSSQNQNANGAPGPYWRRVPNTKDMLYMSSSILNQIYGIFDEEGNNTNGKYYVQAKLDYVGDTNVDFPATIEPDFIEFDPVEDAWSLQIGDEIRFENQENQVYTITSVEGRQAIIPPANPDSDSISDKLQIVVTPPFEDADGNVTEPSNLDFFVVRRYKENKNFIILNQQKPYGFPGTGSIQPSSSPGILLPEHRVEKYNRNPDEVLKDLIEKRII